MVRISTQLLVAALAASPAFAAPLAQSTEKFEARSSDEFGLEAREPISPGMWEFGKKAFTAFAGAASLGATLGPLFFKQKPADKRSFIDQDEFEARGFDEDMEYFVVRDEDGDLHLVAREPITPAALLRFGTTLGTIGGKIAAHSKWAFPALAAGGLTAGVFAEKKMMRSFEDDSLESRYYDEVDLAEREWDDLD